jgi:hypothetical protein
MMRTIKSQVGTVSLSLEAGRLYGEPTVFATCRSMQRAMVALVCHKGTGPASLNSVCLGSSPRVP